ncbi:MAG: hypothetical protein WCH93_03010 [Actinomycetota bacterium]
MTTDTKITRQDLEDRLRMPSVEVSQNVAAKEQPAKKKVVKKAAKAEKPVEVVASVVGEEPVKKTDKTDKTDKAAEKQAKEDAKAAEKKK